MARTNWSKFIASLNKLSEKNVAKNIKHGVNRKYLSERYEKFIERQDKKDGGIVRNVFITEKEYRAKIKQEMDLRVESGDLKKTTANKLIRESVKEYKEEREQFLKDLGVTSTTGSMKQTERIEDLIDETREAEVGEREFGSHKYEETRTWTQDEWEMFEEFKKHMTSDEAMELTFAIINSEEDVIKTFSNKGERTTNNLIEEYKAIQIVKGYINPDLYESLEI